MLKLTRLKLKNAEILFIFFSWALPGRTYWQRGLGLWFVEK